VRGSTRRGTRDIVCEGVQYWRAEEPFWENGHAEGVENGVLPPRRLSRYPPWGSVRRRPNPSARVFPPFAPSSCFTFRAVASLACGEYKTFPVRSYFLPRHHDAPIPY